MNKIVRMSLAALMVGVSLVFVNCSKDGKWDDYNKKGKVYDFTVHRLDSVFAEKAIGETTMIRINLNTRYDFKTLKMRAKVIYNSGKGRLRNELGRTFEPNIDYLVNEPNNVFEYVGSDAGTHKFTIEFFNDKGVKKEEVVTINYATMDFGINFKSMTTGEVYQGDSYNYVLTVVEPKAPQDNHYVIFTEFSEGNISLNNINVKLNKPYLLKMTGGNAIQLTSQKSGRIILRYKIENSTTYRDGEDVTLNFKQREIRTERFQISSNTIVKNTEKHRIWGKVIKTNAPEVKTFTNKIFYKVWLTSNPSGYSSGINIGKENEYQEGVLDGNKEWKLNFNVGDVPTGTYRIGVQFKDEYGNESEAQDFEFNVVGGQPSWITPPASVTLRFHREGGGAFSASTIKVLSVATDFHVSSNNPEVTITMITYRVKYIYFQKTFLFEDPLTFIDKTYRQTYLNLTDVQVFSATPVGLSGLDGQNAINENKVKEVFLEIKVHFSNGTVLNKTFTEGNNLTYYWD